MLLTQNELIDRLTHRLQRAKQVDIAVAWAGECDALDSFLDFVKNRRKFIRAIIGTHGNSTHPSALKRLHGIKSLRLSPSTTLFHPKLYLFHEPDQRVAWVGSANLTRAGFQQNQELVTEFIDDGATSAWFDQLWGACEPDCSARLKAYVAGWKPPAFGAWGTPKPAAKGTVGNLPNGLPKTWPDFVSALLDADAYWEPVFECTVTGEFRSWLSTIELGRALMRRESWDNLTEDEYRLALGIEREKNGYGLLGSMWGAGYAKNVFRVSTPANLEVRRSIRAALQPVLDASAGDFPTAAAEFIQAVNAHQGFAGALATRFMALARPDRAVSVNKGSRRKLADFLGLPETSLAKPNGYKALLARLSDLPWYASPAPKGAFEELLASNRAALVDALVYEVQRPSRRPSASIYDE